MSYCNTCRKWNGAAAVPAGANTDHLCRCPTRAQLRILQAIPIDGPSGSDWVAVGSFLYDRHAGWQQVAAEHANATDVTTLYRKRSAGASPSQPLPASGGDKEKT